MSLWKSEETEDTVVGFAAAVVRKREGVNKEKETKHMRID